MTGATNTNDGPGNSGKVFYSPISHALALTSQVDGNEYGGDVDVNRPPANTNETSGYQDEEGRNSTSNDNEKDIPSEGNGPHAGNPHMAESKEDCGDCCPLSEVRSKPNLESIILDLVDGIMPSSSKTRTLSLLPSIEESNEDDGGDNTSPLQISLTSASSSSSSLSSAASPLPVGNAVVQGVSSKPTLTSISEEPVPKSVQEENSLMECPPLSCLGSNLSKYVTGLDLETFPDGQEINGFFNEEEKQADKGHGDVCIDQKPLEGVALKISTQGIDFPGGEGHVDFKEKCKKDMDLNIIPPSDVIVNVVIQEENQTGDVGSNEGMETGVTVNVSDTYEEEKMTNTFQSGYDEDAKVGDGTVYTNDGKPIDDEISKDANEVMGTRETPEADDPERVGAHLVSALKQTICDETHDNAERTPTDSENATVNDDEDPLQLQSQCDEDKRSTAFGKAKSSGSDSKLADTTSSSCDVSAARESHSEYTMPSSSSEKYERENTDKEIQKQRDKDKDRDGNKRKRERAVDEGSVSDEVKQCLKNAVGDVRGTVKDKDLGKPNVCEIRGSEIKTTCRLEFQIADTTNETQHGGPHISGTNQEHDSNHDSDSISNSLKQNSKRKGKRRRKSNESFSAMEKKSNTNQAPASNETESDSADYLDSSNFIDSSLSASHSDLPLFPEIGEQTDLTVPKTSTNQAVLTLRNVSFDNPTDPHHTSDPSTKNEDIKDEQCEESNNQDKTPTDTQREIEKQTESLVDAPLSNSEFISANESFEGHEPDIYFTAKNSLISKANSIQSIPSRNVSNVITDSMHESLEIGGQKISAHAETECKDELVTSFEEETDANLQINAVCTDPLESDHNMSMKENEESVSELSQDVDGTDATEGDQIHLISSNLSDSIASEEQIPHITLSKIVENDSLECGILSQDVEEKANVEYEVADPAVESEPNFAILNHVADLSDERQQEKHSEKDLSHTEEFVQIDDCLQTGVCETKPQTKEDRMQKYDVEINIEKDVRSCFAGGQTIEGDGDEIKRDKDRGEELKEDRNEEAKERHEEKVQEYKQEDGGVEIEKIRREEFVERENVKEKKQEEEGMELEVERNKDFVEKEIETHKQRDGIGVETRGEEVVKADEEKEKRQSETEEEKNDYVVEENKEHKNESDKGEDKEMERNKDYVKGDKEQVIEEGGREKEFEEEMNEDNMKIDVEQEMKVDEIEEELKEGINDDNVKEEEENERKKELEEIRDGHEGAGGQETKAIEKWDGLDKQNTDVEIKQDRGEGKNEKGMESDKEMGEGEEGIEMELNDKRSKEGVEKYETDPITGQNEGREMESKYQENEEDAALLIQFQQHTEDRALKQFVTTSDSERPEEERDDQSFFQYEKKTEDGKEDEGTVETKLIETMQDPLEKQLSYGVEFECKEANKVNQTLGDKLAEEEKLIIVEDEKEENKEIGSERERIKEGERHENDIGKQDLNKEDECLKDDEKNREEETNDDENEEPEHEKHDVGKKEQQPEWDNKDNESRMEYEQITCSNRDDCYTANEEDARIEERPEQCQEIQEEEKEGTIDLELKQPNYPQKVVTKEVLGHKNEMVDDESNVPEICYVHEFDDSSKVENEKQKVQKRKQDGDEGMERVMKPEEEGEKDVNKRKDKYKKEQDDKIIQIASALGKSSGSTSYQYLDSLDTPSGVLDGDDKEQTKQIKNNFPPSPYNIQSRENESRRALGETDNAESQSISSGTHLNAEDNGEIPSVSNPNTTVQTRVTNYSEEFNSYRPRAFDLESFQIGAEITDSTDDPRFSEWQKNSKPDMLVNGADRPDSSPVRELGTPLFTNDSSRGAIPSEKLNHDVIDNSVYSEINPYYNDTSLINRDKEMALHITDGDDITKENECVTDKKQTNAMKSESGCGEFITNPISPSLCPKSPSPYDEEFLEAPKDQHGCNVEFEETIGLMEEPGDDDDQSLQRTHLFPTVIIQNSSEFQDSFDNTGNEILFNQLPSSLGLVNDVEPYTKATSMFGENETNLDMYSVNKSKTYDNEMDKVEEMKAQIPGNTGMDDSEVSNRLKRTESLTNISSKPVPPKIVSNFPRMKLKETHLEKKSNEDITDEVSDELSVPQTVDKRKSLQGDIDEESVTSTMPMSEGDEIDNRTSLRREIGETVSSCISFIPQKTKESTNEADLTVIAAQDRFPDDRTTNIPSSCKEQESTLECLKADEEVNLEQTENKLFDDKCDDSSLTEEREHISVLSSSEESVELGDTEPNESCLDETDILLKEDSPKFDVEQPDDEKRYSVMGSHEEEEIDLDSSPELPKNSLTKMESDSWKDRDGQGTSADSSPADLGVWKKKPLWRKVIARLKHPRSYRKLKLKFAKQSKQRASHDNLASKDTSRGTQEKQEKDVGATGSEEDDDGWKTLERDDSSLTVSKKRVPPGWAISQRGQWRRLRRLHRLRNRAETIPDKLCPVKRHGVGRNAQRQLAEAHTSTQHSDASVDVKTVTVNKSKGKTRKRRSDLLLHGHVKEVEMAHREVNIDMPEVFEVFCDKDRKEVADFGGSLATKETPTVRLLMKPLMTGLNAHTSEPTTDEATVAPDRFNYNQLIDDTTQMRTRPSTSKRMSCMIM